MAVRHLEDKSRYCSLRWDCTAYPPEKTGSPYLQLPGVAFPVHVVRHCEGAVDGTVGAVGALPLLLQGRLKDHVGLSDRDTQFFYGFCFYVLMTTAFFHLVLVLFFTDFNKGPEILKTATSSDYIVECGTQSLTHPLLSSSVYYSGLHTLTWIPCGLLDDASTHPKFQMCFQKTTLSKSGFLRNMLCKDPVDL